MSKNMTNLELKSCVGPYEPFLSSLLGIVLAGRLSFHDRVIGYKLTKVSNPFLLSPFQPTHNIVHKTHCNCVDRPSSASEIDQ